MAVCMLAVLLLRWFIGLVQASTGISVVFLLGEEATLSCSPYPSYQFPSVRTANGDCRNIHTDSIDWRKIEPVTYISRCLHVHDKNYNTRVTVDDKGNKYNLHILNVQPSDEGRYECVTTRETSLSAQLIIREPLCSVDPQAIAVGNHVSLICSLQIIRVLQWIAPNGTVIASRSGNDQPLVFNFTAGEEHSFGKYTCVAISESGAYNPNCSVIPLEYKFITISPQVSRINQGDNATFTCATRLGLRKPYKYYYTWLRDNNIVLQGLNIPSYTINNLQLSDNGTQVQCKASNDGGEEMESSVAIIYVSATMTTPNPDDASRTRNDGDSLISKSSGYMPGPPDTREGSTTTNTVGLIAGCVGGTVLLLIISVILVIFIKKNKTRKLTGEVEAATTLPRDKDSTSGSSKGRDPSKASTPGVTNQSSSATNENDAVYALPQQKGGGHAKVTTQAVSVERSPTASTASDGHAAAVQSGITVTSKASTPSVANQSSSAVNDNDAVYALPQQKGGGHSNTYDNVTDSRELVDSQESQPNVEGLLYAELEITKSNANDGQIINTTEATLYAAIQQVQ